jgi:hypothetical protein
MPYIDQGIRESLDQGRHAQTGGELNYQISTLLSQFIAMKGLSYAAINEAMGALSCAQAEFYRKVAADYENQKEIQNGTVWNFKQEKQ